MPQSKSEIPSRTTLSHQAEAVNVVVAVSYGVEFSRAVKQKQVAQQEAERSKFVVMKAQQERRVECESEAAKLISDATVAAGMGLIELRRTEASREVASTLAKSPNVAYLPSGKNLFMALNPSR